MARRLVLMAVLPSVTVSEAENFAGRDCSAVALRIDVEVSQAAPRPDAERMRNSRRRIAPPKNCGVWYQATPARLGKGRFCASSLCTIRQNRTAIYVLFRHETALPAIGTAG